MEDITEMDDPLPEWAYSKACMDCKEVQPLDNFHVNMLRTDIHISFCKSCCKKKAANKERVRVPTVDSKPCK